LSCADGNFNFQEKVEEKKDVKRKKGRSQAEKIEVEATEKLTNRPATRSSLKTDAKKRKAEVELSREKPPILAKTNEGKKSGGQDVKDASAGVCKPVNVWQGD
jgi:hypothetical protein